MATWLSSGSTAPVAPDTFTTSRCISKNSASTSPTRSFLPTPRYKNSADYDDYYLAQLDELITRYGDLVEFWLDGAGSAGHVYNFARYLEELRVYQPDALVFADAALLQFADIRWAGNEDGIIPYENWNVLDRNGYLRWRPAEADTPLRKSHWFWQRNDDANINSLPDLTKR